MHFALQIKLYNVQLFYKSINNFVRKTYFFISETKKQGKKISRKVDHHFSRSGSCVRWFCSHENYVNRGWKNYHKVQIVPTSIIISNGPFRSFSIYLFLFRSILRLFFYLTIPLSLYP